MKPGMKMLMLTGRGRDSGNGRMEDSRSYGPESHLNGPMRRFEYGEYNYPSGDRSRLERNYGASGGHPEYDGRYEWVESRFRDRRGREHYDNGRYAPMNDMDDDEDARSRQERRGHLEDNYGNMAYTGSPYVPPVYDDGERRSMNRIGFSSGEEIGNNYRTSAEHHQMDEVEHRSGEYMAGHGAVKSYPAFSKESAEEWTRGMENEDGTKGPHWTLEQAKQVMAQRNIDCDPLEFWAVLNAVYSDYSALAKRHNVNSMDFYADMAKAWLSDKDAVKDKAAAYFEYVVKH